jgi:hypothetical protein
MGEEEDTLNFLESMSSTEKDTSIHVYTRNQQQIALFIRTYITKWNTSELQSDVYPNRRDTYPLNTTEKDILLVKNTLHNKEYDINIMNDINKEKEKEGRKIRKQMK